jgi:hypothetical protein
MCRALAQLIAVAPDGIINGTNLHRSCHLDRTLAGDPGCPPTGTRDRRMWCALRSNNESGLAPREQSTGPLDAAQDPTAARRLRRVWALPLAPTD